MRALLILTALAAACGDRQIVLELTGAAPGATHVDVVLLEPEVIAQEQRHNDPARLAEGSLETVFYMEERSRTPIDLRGAPLDGFQVEVRDAGGPFVPLVAAWSGERGAPDEQLLALGVYAPDTIAAAPLGRAYVPATASPVSDVTIFQIDLEPVDGVLAPAAASDLPRPVKPREVMRVPCGTTGAISGIAWRWADGHELRVLAQIPTSSSGDGRLAPPDLDCDRHSPGRAQVQRTELGDQRDCDDTAAAVHGEARERCSKLVDEDCNSDTTLSSVPCTQTCANSILQICECDDAGASELCTSPIAIARCKVASTSSGGTGRLPCESAGPIKLADCVAGCEVLLEWAPEGLEVSISDDPGTAAYGLGKWAPLTDATAYLSIGGERALSDPNVDVLARVRVGALTADISIPLVLVEGACDPSPAPFACPM